MSERKVTFGRIFWPSLWAALTVSIIGIIILFYIFKDEKHFYSLFFAFIAAVTFPHAIVMMSMFTKKSNK